MSYLPQQPQGITSVLNSSIVPLAAGATFTGTGELNTYADVMTTIATDQNGIYYCEFSPDGTNWDSTLTFYYDTARINPPHVIVKGNRYWRARFTNTSASAQTYFRFNSFFGSFEKLTSPINGQVSENFDALVVRPTDYKYEVARSKRQGDTTWNKYGYNNDIDGTAETVWPVGGLLTRLTSASTLSIVSTSASDTSAGTGAQSIIVYGIDANFNSVT